VVPLNASPVQTPKVYQLSELGMHANSSDSEERSNDSGRGKSHVVYMPGSMVGTDQYIMRNRKIRIRTVLVRYVGVPAGCAERWFRCCCDHLRAITVKLIHLCLPNCADHRPQRAGLNQL
jgi:hypothetical protein